MEKKQTWMIISCILLGLYLFVRLMDQTAIFTRFPLDNINDISSYFGILHFLDKYGYYGTAPEWYNGYTVLKYYSPGWWFLTYPLYLVSQNVQTASYASIILMLGLGLACFLALGKALKLTKTESTLFFLLFFANPINIGDFYRLGRLPTMFAWLTFIAVAAILYHYKEKKYDWKFILLYTFFLSAAIISHPGATILTAFLVLSFFLIKNWKEKLILFLSSVLSLLLTAFWWLPFILDLSKSTVQNFVMHSFLLQKAWIGNLLILFLVCLTFLFLLYINLKTTKSRKELLFYLPQIILLILLATQLMKYIPGLNQVYANFLIIFFLFFDILLYLAIDFRKIGINRSQWDKALLALCILAILASHLVTGYYPNQDSPVQKNAFAAIDHLSTKYAFLGSSTKEVYPKVIYSYAAIYKGLSTISGWSTHELTPERLEYIQKVGVAFQNTNCGQLSNLLSESNVQEIMLYAGNCNKLASCNFKLKYKNDDFCIYRLSGQDAISYRLPA